VQKFQTDLTLQMRNSLVEEIRNSLHCETQQLRLQMQSTEQQLSQLRTSMSAPPTPVPQPSAKEKRFSFNMSDHEKPL
jgi:hypothetical protein